MVRWARRKKLKEKSSNINDQNTKNQMTKTWMNETKDFKMHQKTVPKICTECTNFIANCRDSYL